MSGKVLKRAIGILIAGLNPVIVVADTGEGLIELLALQSMRIFNLLWPFLVPLGLISRARKKLSFYLYSLVICGLSAWLLVHLLPQQLLGWLEPEFTVKNLRIALVYMIVATAVAFAVSVSLSRRIREFNDSHD